MHRPPVRMSEETLGDEIVRRLGLGPLKWPGEVFAAKIEPIEDEI